MEETNLFKDAAESDKKHIKWAQNQTDWTKTIGTFILNSIYSLCCHMKVVSEKHEEMENLISEWARVERERADAEDAARLIEGGDEEAERRRRRDQHYAVRVLDRNDRIVPPRDVADAFQAQIGSEFFDAESYVSALQTGVSSFRVTIDILPDILIPERGEAATIDMFVPRNNCLDIEVAVSTTMFQELSRGGDRFINELSRHVMDHIQDHFRTAAADGFGISTECSAVGRRDDSTDTLTRSFSISVNIPKLNYKGHASAYLTPAARDRPVSVMATARWN
jgi:hypothetical protein